MNTFVYRKRSLRQPSCFNPITNIMDSVGFSEGKNYVWSFCLWCTQDVHVNMCLVSFFLEYVSGFFTVEWVKPKAWLFVKYITHTVIWQWTEYSQWGGAESIRHECKPSACIWIKGERRHVKRVLTKVMGDPAASSTSLASSVPALVLSHTRICSLTLVVWTD